MLFVQLKSDDIKVIHSNFTIFANLQRKVNITIANDVFFSPNEPCQ